MKTAEMGEILSSDEPVLVTREGQVSGLYLPLKKRGAGSDDPRWELISLLERYISETLEAQGVTEEEIQEDFNAFRRLRR